MLLKIVFNFFFSKLFEIASKPQKLELTHEIREEKLPAYFVQSKRNNYFPISVDDVLGPNDMPFKE